MKQKKLVFFYCLFQAGCIAFILSNGAITKYLKVLQSQTYEAGPLMSYMIISAFIFGCLLFVMQFLHAKIPWHSAIKVDIIAFAFWALTLGFNYYNASISLYVFLLLGVEICLLIYDICYKSKSRPNE